MGKDIEKQYLKAEKLYKAMQYKRAAKKFGKVGDLYLKSDNFELARDCYFDAAKCSINEEKYLVGLEFLRKTGNALLLTNDIAQANEIFRKAINYIPNLRKSSNQNQNYILFSCLSYLCFFIKGEQEEGLKLVKKIKNFVDDTYFKESSYIHLITNLTMVISEKDQKYVDRIKNEFTNLKFWEAEVTLAKEALVIAKVYASLRIDLNFDKELYTTNEAINLMLNIDTEPLLEIVRQDIYAYKLKELIISKIGFTLSDNLTSQKNHELPISIQVGQSKEIRLMVKPHFQMENSFIGPILLSLELDGNLLFSYEISQRLKPNLISPPPTLEISTRNLRTPLIDQTFPLEILIENKSEGEALNLTIEVEFPEQIKIMRGTLKKQIYSLRSNENIKWEINLKPTEAGNYIFRVFSKFNDPDQNLIEDSKEFSLDIKL